MDNKKTSIPANTDDHGPYKILLADDEAEFWVHAIEMAIKISMQGLGLCTITKALTPQQCREKLKQTKFDLVILDNNFGSVDDGECTLGIQLLPEIVNLYPETPLIMFSNFHDPITTIKARAYGAKDFISKTHEPAEIGARILSILKQRQNQTQSQQQRQDLAAIAGAAYSSAVMDRVFEKVVIARLSLSLDTLITGEPGVGKELIAQAIHNARADSPFVRINCGAIPKDLLESELFGHAKGAFTGALTDKIGKFEAACGGDIFLDEVGTLSPAAQVALLRVLECREVIRLGSHLARPIKIRVIAATNDNLDELVERNLFRKDLLSRLRGFEIALPPLRDRKADIPIIVQALLARSDSPQTKIDPLCLEVLEAFDWPDNVRGLRNVLYAAQAAAKAAPAHPMITVQHLPDEFVAAFQINPSDQPEAPRANDGTNSDRHYLMNLDLSLAEANDDFLRHFIALKRQRLGSKVTQRRLAESLKVPRATLNRRLAELGV